MSKQVRIIVSDWLKANGYDGLVNGDGECGCPIGDLMPCENSIAGLGDCQPAYRYECWKCRNWCDNLPFDVESDEYCDKQNPDYAEIFATDKAWCVPDYMRKEDGDDR